MDRNTEILKSILQYCDEIKSSLDYFGDDYKIFISNSHFRNDISMCLMQIGEFAKELTKEFKERTSQEIAWKEIRGMRNLFAHAYPTMSFTEIFKTAHTDIPELKNFCLKEIGAIEIQSSTSQISLDDLESDDYEPEM